MLVRELMNPAVVTIPASHSCFEAALRMSRFRVRHLPVLDDAGRLAGIVTDRDLRAELFLEIARATPHAPIDVEDVLRERDVRSVMSSPAVTASPDDAVAGAVRVMAERKIGALPVVTDGRLVGIVTDTDLLRELFRRRLLRHHEVEALLIPAA